MPHGADDTTSDHSSAIAEEERTLGELLDHLEAARARTRARLDEALGAGGGTHQSRSERESYVRMYSAELRAFGAANYGLYFGRLDAADGEVRRIGRVGLRDDDYRPLLLDWRADNSRPFYLATTARPEGMHRRRHLRTLGRRVTGVHDEYLTLPGDGEVPEDHDDVVGESALLLALEAARTGHMQDIVATIQREQDEIIRHPHRGVVVVQGGPGTGKTAVALHRAAYLLYTYREILDRSGVLIVGPNSTFLDYIARVLPSLGESGVVLRTVGDLYPGVHARGTDSLRSQEVKGSPEMVPILTAAVRARQTAPEDERVVRVEGVELTLTPAEVRRARGRARMTRKPHNRAQKAFVDHLVDTMTDHYVEALTAPVADAEAAAWDPGPDGVGELGDPRRPLITADEKATVRQEIRESAAVREAVESWWPRLQPEDVLAELLSDRGRIAEAAGEYVEEDQAALHRADGRAFSPADVPLLDELAEIIGIDPEADRLEEERSWAEQLRQAEEALEILAGSASQDVVDEVDPEVLMAYDVVDATALAGRHRADSDLSVADRAAADRNWAYGHVIVDEAQELSPMAWRALGRRSPNRWMTVVGDVAQTSSPAGADSWAESLAPLVENRWVGCELTVNYRTPATVSEVSTRLLARIDPGATPPRPVREGREPVSWWSGPADELVGRMARLRAAVPADRAVAALLPEDAPDELAAELRAAAAALSVLTVAEAKGLEFDVVLLVDPSGVVERSPQGLQDLYVATTRATQELHILQPGEFTGVVAELRSELAGT